MINNKKVYKVVDYLTPAEVCKAIGISEKSTPLITRWINNGKIKGYRQFGNNLAIPVNWVKSECQSRGIDWQGVELEDNEIGVSLDDYMPISKLFTDKKELDRVYNRLRRGTYNDEFIRFGNSYGLPKK